jgi:hypothetical protein
VFGATSASLGPASPPAQPAITPNPVTLNSANQASFSYLGTRTGLDTLTVWLDGLPDGQVNEGEPVAVASVNWIVPTATATPSITSTPTVTPTRTPTRTPTATRTPTPTRTRKAS